MGEEQGLSAERMHSLYAKVAHLRGPLNAHATVTVEAGELIALLNTCLARSEGLQPPVGVEGEVLSSLEASKAPSSASAGVAETPSEGAQ